MADNMKTPLLRHTTSLEYLSPKSKHRNPSQPGTASRNDSGYQNERTDSENSVFTDGYNVTSTESLRKQCSEEYLDVGSSSKTNKQNINTCSGYFSPVAGCSRESVSDNDTPDPDEGYQIYVSSGHHTPDVGYEDYSSDSIYSDDNYYNAYTQTSNCNDDEFEEISEHHNPRKEKYYKHKLRKNEERENVDDDNVHQQYLNKQRQHRRSRSTRSCRTEKNSNNKSDHEFDTDSLLSSAAYGYSLSYTSIAELQGVECVSEDELEAKTCQLFKGMLLALISGILFTANNFVLVHFDLNPIDAVYVRGFVHVVILSTVLRGKVWCEKLWLAVLQGTVGALSLTCALFCVTLMPIPDALTILFTSPLPTFILAVICKGESASLMKILSMVCLLFGVVLVCQPSFLFPHHAMAYSKEVYIGIMLAISSSLLTGVVNLVACLSKDIANTVIVFWVALAALIISSVLEFAVPGCLILTLKVAQYSATQWCILFGLALSGLAAYFSMIKSLKMISPTLVATLRSLEIVLAFGVQIILDGSLPNPISSAGAFLVCFGICMSGIASYRTRPRSGYQSV